MIALETGEIFRTATGRDNSAVSMSEHQRAIEK
jgi:hypothetical protein